VQDTRRSSTQSENTRCPIDTVISPDDGHIIVRNTYRIEINIKEKLCARLVLFTRQRATLYFFGFGKIAITGIPNCPNYCVIFIVYT